MNVKESTAQLRREAAKVIIGQTEVFDQMMIALLARGHVLLEGVPGIAKTLAANIDQLKLYYLYKHCDFCITYIVEHCNSLQYCSFVYPHSIDGFLLT